jgi:hypothetical protein
MRVGRRSRHTSPRLNPTERGHEAARHLGKSYVPKNKNIFFSNQMPAMSTVIHSFFDATCAAILASRLAMTCIGLLVTRRTHWRAPAATA